MAKVTSHITLKGMLGQFCFYELDGKSVMRRVGEVPRKRYKNAPEFARMRENSAEFGGASRIGKGVRAGLGPLVKQVCDPYVSGRLNGVLRKIIAQGPGERGAREFRTTITNSLLEGFEWNKKTTLDSKLCTPHGVASNASRNNATWALENLIPAMHLDAPAGATHFQLILHIHALSDHVYDSIGKSYVPLHPELNGQSVTVLSSPFSLGDRHSQIVSLTATLSDNPILPAGAGLVVSVGTLFLQEVNGVFHAIKGGAMRVVLVL